MDRREISSIIGGIGIAMVSYFAPLYFEPFPKWLSGLGLLVGVLLVASVYVMRLIPKDWIRRVPPIVGLRLGRAQFIADAVYRSSPFKPYLVLASELEALTAGRLGNLTQDKLLVEMIRFHVAEELADVQEFISAMSTYAAHEHSMSELVDERRELDRYMRNPLEHRRNADGSWNCQAVAGEITANSLSKLLRENDLKSRGMTKDQFIQFLKANDYLL